MKENKKIFCAIDTETTGLESTYAELIQLAILPLNDDFTEHQIIPPFEIRIKADDLSDRDGSAAIHKLDPNEGYTREEARNLFYKWLEEAQEILGFKKITPIGQNYTFDLQFIRKWLGGDKVCRQYFDRDYRDTKMTANFINDVQMFKKETPVFAKTGLGELCEHFGIDNHNHHDAMNDARVTARVYAEQVKLLAGK